MGEALATALMERIQILILELQTLDGVNESIIEQLTDALERVGICEHRGCIAAQFALVSYAVMEDKPHQLIMGAFNRASCEMVQAYREHVRCLK